MRWMAIAAVIAATACGGSEGQKFAGDVVVAEVLNGQPFCNQGQSGPTTTMGTVAVPASSDHPAYDSKIVECEWTCGNINGNVRSFVFVIFYTDATGSWVIDPHADPYQDRVRCPG